MPGLCPFPCRARTKRRPSATPIPKRPLRFLRYARERTDRYVVEIDGKLIKAVKRSFKTACDTSGLPPFSPHILRHSCVTWLKMKGKSSFKVGKYVGMTEEMVERRYGHHSPEYLEDVAEAMDG